MPWSHLLFPSLIRGLDLAGMILLVGGLVFKILVASENQGSRLERILPFFLLVTAACDLVLRAQMMSDRPFGEIWEFLPMVLLKSHFGKVWMLRIFLLCLLALTSTMKSAKGFKRSAAPVAGAALLLTASLSGHAADFGDLSLAVLADGFHLMAVSAWAGGLVFLASMLRHRMASPTAETALLMTAVLKRFSALAAVCVFAILVTGGYQAWLQVASIGSLLHTSYGRTLIVKLLLVFPLLALGALNRYRYLPKLSFLASAQPAGAVWEGAQRLLRSVTLEIGLGIGIIACAALMTQQPPAKSQPALAFEVFSHGETHAHPQESSTRQPAEGASVTILFPLEGQVIHGDEVPIRYKFMKGKRGSHLHAYIDGELMGMLSDPERGTLTGIQPGRHVLDLRVAAGDHQTELDAADSVEFAVR